MDITTLFAKGGVVMVVLGMLSIYTISVVLFKIFQFIAAGAFERGFIEPTMNAIRQGEIDRAQELLAKAKGPVARIIQVSMDCVRDREMLQASREAEISRVGSADIRYLESHLRGLEMIANVGPLLGLLGTVMGMVEAFSKLETAGTRVDPALLAGGIWEALLTTVGGLVVAIPAVAAYYIFDGIIERVRGSMKEVSLQIMMLENTFQKTERQSRKQQAEMRMKERQERERVERQRLEQLRHEREREQQAREQEMRVRENELKEKIAQLTVAASKIQGDKTAYKESETVIQMEQARLQQLQQMQQKQRQEYEAHLQALEEKRHAIEQQQRETEQRLQEESARLRGEAERMHKAAETMRSTAQSSSTLKLLNPRYIQF
jgi:biopolymer transport protein ExbB